MAILSMPVNYRMRESILVLYAFINHKGSPFDSSLGCDKSIAPIYIHCDSFSWYDVFFSKLAKAHKLSTAVTNIAKDCVNPFVGSQLLVMMLRILNVIKIKEKMSHWVKLDLLYLTCISKHMQEFNDLKLFMETTYLIVLKYWA